MAKGPKPGTRWKWAKRHRKGCKDCGKRLTSQNCAVITKRGRKYRHTYCRDCNSARSAAWQKKHPILNARIRWATNLKRFYGVTVQWYDQKLAEQGGGCAICGAKRGNGHRLSLDHDHARKRNRGILCGRCNHSLERIERVEGWPQKAAEYLNRYSVAV